MNKRVALLCVICAFIVNFTACSNFKSKKELEEGKIDIESRDYEKENIDNNNKEAIISNGLSIIKENGYKNIGFDSIVKEKMNLPELEGKELYHFVENIPDSPKEFYYDAPENKMYHINQGMWFIINENFKNATPLDSEMYEDAEKYRKDILIEKIAFTTDQGREIVELKKKELGLLKFRVFEEDPRVIDEVKLYFVSGETNTENKTIVEFFVGSDGNLYDTDGVINEEKLQLLVKWW